MFAIRTHTNDCPIVHILESNWFVLYIPGECAVCVCSFIACLGRHSYFFYLVCPMVPSALRMLASHGNYVESDGTCVNGMLVLLTRTLYSS